MKYSQDSTFVDIDRQLHLVVCVSILVIGTGFSLIPSSWLGTPLLNELVSLVKHYWPKINYEYKVVDFEHHILQKRDAFFASKYVLSNVFSFVFYFFVLLLSAFCTKNKIPFEVALPSYFKMSNLVIMPALTLLVLYFAVFDQLAASSDTKISNQIFQSVACIFWPPLLFGTLALALFRTGGVFLAKLHGKL